MAKEGVFLCGYDIGLFFRWEGGVNVSHGKIEEAVEVVKSFRRGRADFSGSSMMVFATVGFAVVFFWGVRTCCRIYDDPKQCYALFEDHMWIR